IPAKDGALAGVLLIDIRTGAFRFVVAQAVLLATGGGPTMYRYHTPSGDKSMDGLAMALRAGVPLRDMEVVQFHPPGLLAGAATRMTGTVLEEGLRGAGGHLLTGATHRSADAVAAQAVGAVHAARILPGDEKARPIGRGIRPADKAAHEVMRGGHHLDEAAGEIEQRRQFERSARTAPRYHVGRRRRRARPGRPRSRHRGARHDRGRAAGHGACG